MNGSVGYSLEQPEPPDTTIVTPDDPQHGVIDSFLGDRSIATVNSVEWLQ